MQGQRYYICHFLPCHGCGPDDELINDSSIKLLQDVEDKSEDGSAILDEVGWSAHLFATRKQLWLCNAIFDSKEICRLANNLFEVALAKRIAKQLGCYRQDIYRSGWAPTFPTEQTDRGFHTMHAKMIYAFFI